jgi:hypothetical protein
MEILVHITPRPAQEKVSIEPRLFSHGNSDKKKLPSVMLLRFN